MAGLSFFSWLGGSTSGESELPDIYSMPLEEKIFVDIDVLSIYAKILTDTLERTHGIQEENLKFLFDNCLASEGNKGLISLLAEGMVSMSDLFLVFKNGVLRLADDAERKQITEDYKRSASSEVGIFISFKKYTRTEMMKLYSSMEYSTIASMNKGAKLSRAIQYKMGDMRGNVSLSDSAGVTSQAQTMAKALACGKDILMDAKDKVELAEPAVDSTEKQLKLIDKKRCYYLGMPESYLTGEQTGSGLSDTGNADTKAADRGLKSYFFSIIKPVVDELFVAKTTFKAQDAINITQALEALKVFNITDESIISAENKLLLINKLFDLPENSKGDQVQAPKLLPPAGNVPRGTSDGASSSKNNFVSGN